MSEGTTFKQYARKERWCMEKVDEGRENWPANASWHPLRGYCKGRGTVLVKNEWRCKKHAPEGP